MTAFGYTSVLHRFKNGAAILLGVGTFCISARTDMLSKFAEGIHRHSLSKKWKCSKSSIEKPGVSAIYPSKKRSDKIIRSDFILSIIKEASCCRRQDKGRRSYVCEARSRGKPRRSHRKALLLRRSPSFSRALCRKDDRHGKASGR